MARMYATERVLDEDYVPPTTWAEARGIVAPTPTPAPAPYVPPYVPPLAVPVQPTPTPVAAPPPAALSPLDMATLPTPQPEVPVAPAGPLSMADQQQAAWAEAAQDPVVMMELQKLGYQPGDYLPIPEQPAAPVMGPAATPEPVGALPGPTTAAPLSPTAAGIQFLTNAGKFASAKDKKGGSGYITYNPAGQYRLVNERKGGGVLYEGTGNAALDEVFRQSQELSRTQGKKADWRVEVYNPATGRWEMRADDDPKNNTLGKIADIGLPLLGAALAPLTGGMSAVLLAGLGGAGGSVLSSVLQGRSLKDTALRGALSGLGAAGGASLFGPMLGTASNNVLGIGGSLAAKTATGATTGALTNTGTNLAANVGEDIIRVIGERAATQLGANTLGNAAINTVIPGALSMLDPWEYGASQMPTQDAPYSPAPSEDVINVIGTPGSGGLSAAEEAAAAAAITGGVTQLPSVLPGESNTEITVTGEKEVDPSLAGFGPPAAATVAPDVAKEILTKAADETSPTKDGEGGTLSDIANYLRLASLVTGLGGSLLGGKKKNLVPGGLGGGGSLNPIFGGSLPTNPSIPGTGGLSSFGPRQMPAQDWDLYGTRPEQSFFTSVPQTYNPPAPGVFDAWSPYSRGYAMGGAVEYAGGGPLSVAPGGGRADDVPAMLSDGEYVIDAETVALLGDGSFDEGSRKLDSLRVNVRKHKGRDLAKGRISPDARPAERYLGAR